MRLYSVGFIVLLVLLCVSSIHGKCLNDGDTSHSSKDFAQRLFNYASRSPVQPSTSSDLKFMTINLQSGYLTNCKSDPYTQANFMKGMDFVGSQETVQNVDTRCNRCNLPQIIADTAGMSSRFVMTIPWRTGQYGIAAATSQTILETRHVMLDYGGVEQRVAVAIRTQPLALKGRNLWFINTHVEFYNGAARQSQIGQLMTFVRGISSADSKAVFVMAGDFNGGPWDAGYSTIKANGFKNAWETFFGSILQGNTIPADWPGSRFDHIWFRESNGVTIKSKNAQVADVRLSDHRPLIATLSFSVSGSSSSSSGSSSGSSGSAPAPSNPTPSTSGGSSGAGSGDSSVVCVGPIWEGAPVTFTCPKSSQKISQVQFASYGTPTGTCGNFKLGKCIGGSSMAVVKDKCVGRNTCTFPVANNVFGDPCPGTGKHLRAQVLCA
jgi:endonuclease/exonuclease/phosphatase family metal-dependent hydrolase